MGNDAYLHDLIPSGNLGGGRAGGGRLPPVPGGPRPNPNAPKPVDLPPQAFAPRDATDFNLQFQATGLNAGNTPITPAGLTFQVPDFNVAVIRTLTLNVNNMLTSTDIRWTLRKDASPIQGWEGLTIFPRAAASVSKSWAAEETFILIPEGGQISVTIQVLDAGTYQIGADVHGWFYPESVAQRWSS